MFRTKENMIELFAWLITCLLLVKYIPKNKVKEASISFLFKHVITWLFGLLVVEKGLISYPSRLFFNRSTRSSFTFEYFVYPALCSLYNIYYPENKSLIKKIVYQLYHPAIITIFEVYAVKNTKLIKYKKWNWFMSFFTMWLSYLTSHYFYKWIFPLDSNQTLKSLSES